MKGADNATELVRVGTLVVGFCWKDFGGRGDGGMDVSFVDLLVDAVAFGNFVDIFLLI